MARKPEHLLLTLEEKKKFKEFLSEVKHIITQKEAAEYIGTSRSYFTHQLNSGDHFSKAWARHVIDAYNNKIRDNRLMKCLKLEDII